MTKVLNWGAIRNQNWEDGQRTNPFTGVRVPTGKEAFAKAYEEQDRQAALALRKAEVLPILKNELIKSMLNQTPIKVMAPIQNYTEGFNGATSANSEDDDGFYNSSPAASAEAILKARFQETIETIPRGIELIFKSWDRNLGQWIFKGSNGREYAIYDKMTIMVGDAPHSRAVENPGLYGLLFQTSLADILSNEE